MQKYSKHKINSAPFSFNTYQGNDGTWVIEIDTTNLPENNIGPLCRVYLNEGCLYENPKFKTCCGNCTDQCVQNI